MIIDQAVARSSKRLAAVHSLTKNPLGLNYFHSGLVVTFGQLSFELARTGPTTLWRSPLRFVTTIPTDPNQTEIRYKQKFEAKKTRPKPGF